jgi:TatD DNase family protein
LLVDSHAHLDASQFDEDRDEVIQRAGQAGVEWILTVGTNLVESQKAVEIAQQYPQILAAVGVHPHEAQGVTEEVYSGLKNLSQSKKVVAIGEIGLDFYHQLSPLEIQREVFRRQIQLARELHLPIIVHDREAHGEILHILRSEKASDVRGIFHCFSGDYQLAREAIDMGFYISISGIVTFHNAAWLRDVVREIPLDNLLVETDCPYLAPVPKRGKRNEPAYVTYTVAKIAEIKNIEVEKVEEATAENFLKFFNLKI